MKNQLQDAPADAIGIKLSVKDSGCSGYAYVLDFATESTNEDQLFEFSGLKIVIPTNSIKILAGTILDYIKDGINSQLLFKNPNAINHCGCGESFQVVEDKS